MENRIEQLLALQDLDRRLDRARGDLNALPGELERQEKEMTGHQARFQESVDLLEQNRKMQASLKSDQQDLRTRVADYRNRLLSIKTNDEYRTMLKQIDFALGKIDDLDTALLEAMEEEESLEERVRKAEKELERHRTRFETRKTMLEEQQRQLERETDRLLAERESAAAAVDLKSLRKYEQARSSGRAEIVVGLRAGACGGCLTLIPPQNGVEIKGGNTFNCPMCGCYVVWTEDSSLAGNRNG